MNNYTRIDGIASSQAVDTAGEVVDLKGLDISSLIGSAFNFEHESKLPSQIVGKILDAKKIFSESDCENERHRYYWEKCRLPFLYVFGRLLDDKKESSKEVAALFKDDAEHPDEPDMVGFSVEGSKIEKVGSVVTRSIARKVTITHIPANKQCVAELVPTKEGKNDDLSSLFKGEIELFAFEPSYIELLEKADAHGEPLMKPYSSEAQRRWAHTPAGKEALGGEAGVHEWDEATKGKKLPEKVGKAEMKKDVGTGNGAFIGSQLAMSEDKELEKGMYSTDVGEKIPARELQQPNINTGAAKAKNWKVGDPNKGLAGTSIGQGEDVRAGNMSAAKDAAGRALRYEQRLPKPKLPKSEEMNKALTAGSMMAAPGNLEGGAALTPESLERRSQNVNALSKKEKSHWYSQADEAYQSWPDRENFRGYMKKRMPQLADGEVDAIGRVLALKKSRQKEGMMSKMFASYYTKAEDMDKTTDVMMANEDTEMDKYLMQSEDKKKDK